MRRIGLAVAFALYLAPSPLAVAQQPEPHWLIGRWDGRITGGFVGQRGPARTLRVTKVDSNGLAQGLWYITGEEDTHSAHITVSAGRVRVVTAAKSIVDLTAEGDSLRGTFLLRDGRSFPVELVKAQAPDHPLVDEWAGTWRGSQAGQYTGPYYLTIDTVEANTVRGKFWLAAMGRAYEGRFRGVLAGNSLTYRLGNDTVVELIIEGDEMRGDNMSALYGPSKVSLRKKK